MQHLKPTKTRAGLRRLIVAGTLALGLSAPMVQADQVDEMNRMVGLMSGFFDLMDSMYDAASNPEHAALIQMNTLEDIYKDRGQHAEIIPVYRQVLKDARNPTVRRIAYMRLADALKETGRADEAIKVLQEGIRETVADTNAAQ